MVGGASIPSCSSSQLAARLRPGSARVPLDLRRRQGDLASPPCRAKETALVGADGERGGLDAAPRDKAAAASRSVTPTNGFCLLKGKRVSHQVMWEDLQIS